MKLYLLDSAPLGAYLQNRKEAVKLISSWIKLRQTATSILVYAEIIGYIKGLPDFYHWQI